MRRPFVFLLFLLFLLFGIFLNQAGRSRDAFRQICDLTADHFYRDDARLEKWVHECNRRAAVIPTFAGTARVLAAIQDMMNIMEVSHFSIYSPVEDKRLWKGESVDTGIRSRYVEDRLIVYRVLKDSAAARAGVQAGDDILQIEGATQLTPWGAQHRSGIFSLRRYGQSLHIQVEAETYVMDQTPHFTRLDAHTALLEISSFRSDFFERKFWQHFVAQFSGFAHVIVDVRENSGGNFVAMLRALSTFQCAGHKAGQILQPRKDLPVKVSYDDELSDDLQLQELDRFRSLGLVTYGDYGCYRGRVTVLIGPETSSVAEIFAHDFLSRPNSRVWGLPTAGDVLLAVWYDLPALGTGFSVSIPEAIYLTPDHKQLENQGVWPQRELHYDLKSSLAGRDGWIDQALLKTN